MRTTSLTETPSKHPHVLERLERIQSPADSVRSMTLCVNSTQGATKKADDTWAKRRKLQDDAEEKLRAEEDERMRLEEVRLEEERRRQAELDAVPSSPFGSFFDSEPTIAMVAGLVTLVMIHLGNTL